MRSIDDIERALDGIFGDDDPKRPAEPAPATLNATREISQTLAELRALAAPRPAATTIVTGPPKRDRPPPVEPVKPNRRRGPSRKRVGRRVRWWLVLALVSALVAGAVVAATRYLVVEQDARQPLGGPPIPEQDVVAWTLWQDEPPGPVVVAVVATGGDRGPVALGIPAYTVVNIPGFGVGTVGDAARLGEPALVATTVGNILGIEIDRFAGTTFSDLERLVDGVGGIVVNEREMTGKRVISYLRKTGAGETGELRFLRGQEVIAGLLAAAGNTEEAVDTFPAEIRPILGLAALEEVPLFELPVEGIGAGLARPNDQEIARLVTEWFVPTAGLAEGVRLVILNGNGAPGVGKRVATILVPAGFRLVSSGNAERFDLPDTRVVASTRDFLDEAELARRLLGVGRVYLGEQPTGVADVTVVVGRDFGGA